MYKIGWEILELMYSPLRWHARTIHQLCKRIPGYTSLTHTGVLRRTGRLLDFGCGHGTSLLELRKRDQLDIYGLDPYSPIRHPAIIRTSLMETKLPPDYFDGIMAIETFEHITNPLEIFKELNRILKPGGLLLAQTHRLEDPEYQRHQDKWFYLRDPKTHVSIYSKQAMRKIAAQTGWKSVSFKGSKFARFIK